MLRWKPPRPVKYKINVDIAIVQRTRSFSIGMVGMVIRDHNGNLVGSSNVCGLGVKFLFLKLKLAIGVDKVLSWNFFLDLYHVRIEELTTFWKLIVQ